MLLAGPNAKSSATRANCGMRHLMVEYWMLSSPALAPAFNGGGLNEIVKASTFLAGISPPPLSTIIVFSKEDYKKRRRKRRTFLWVKYITYSNWTMYSALACCCREGDWMKFEFIEYNVTILISCSRRESSTLWHDESSAKARKRNFKCYTRVNSFPFEILTHLMLLLACHSSAGEKLNVIRFVCVGPRANGAGVTVR